MAQSIYAWRGVRLNPPACTLGEAELRALGVKPHIFPVGGNLWVCELDNLGHIARTPVAAYRSRMALGK